MSGRAGGQTTGRVARDLPPHGTTARAKGRPASGVSGCHCPPCRDAQNRYNKRRRVLNATGRPLRVPAGPVAAHVRALLAAGTTWPALERAAGCSRATIATLLHGQESMRRSVAERILAVRFTEVPGHVPTDATGSVRRVRALYAAGWMQRDIAAAAGLDRCTVSDLLAGLLAQVRVGTARPVRSAFAVLEMRRPPEGLGAVRARNRAAREGWAPPLAWGEDIDDPGRCRADGRRVVVENGSLLDQQPLPLASCFARHQPERR